MILARIAAYAILLGILATLGDAGLYLAIAIIAAAHLIHFAFTGRWID